MIDLTPPDPATIDRIKDRGFAVVPQVVGATEVREMRSRLAEAIQEDLETWGDNPNYIDHWMVHNLMLRGAPFVRLLENPVIHGYLSELLSPHCILYAYTSSDMPPGGSNYSHRVHVDAHLFIPGYVTNVGVLVALDDFSKENGATFLLPGSHMIPEQPSETEFFRDAEQVYPKAGDAIIFNARCWHYGGLNQTDRIRHTVTMNVCRHYMRQRFNYPQMMNDEILGMLGPLGRRFLGFDVRVPKSLEEYYRPPAERLYKPGQY